MRTITYLSSRLVASIRGRKRAGALVVGILLFLPGLRAAEVAATADANSQADELAKQLSNPIAALISVPFQANEDFNIGTANGQRFTLNIQPVIPISITKDWNLILRTILPIISQHDVFGQSGTQSGLGNTTQSFFFSPKAPGPGGIIWGVGPVGYYPTNTDNFSGRINGASARPSLRSCKRRAGPWAC